MADIKWIKLSTDIFDNRKIKQLERMPDGDAIIIIWLKLLVLASDVNDGGCVYFTKDIPYTDELLATEFNRSIATIRLALEMFARFGMIEVVDEIIMISNWERYQNIDGMDKIREQNRERQARFKAKQKALLTDNVTGNVTVTQGNATDKNRKDKNRKEKEKNINTIVCEFANGDSNLSGTIFDFIEMRKHIKKPLTEKALQLVLNKLTKLSTETETQIKILEQSITHDWQSVYPLKSEEKTGANGVKITDEKEDILDGIL